MTAIHRPARIAALALLLAAGGAAAQDFAVDWNPRSGDAWIDQYLADMNQYGDRHRDSFIDEMVRYYGAPRLLVTELLTSRRWAPGDVYYACAIGQIIGRACQYVVDEWDRSHGEGWGVVAQRLGIRPGSAEFHRLKRGFVPTYDRWSRPMRLDAELERHYSERDHPQTHGQQGNDRGRGNPDHRGGKPGHGG